MNDTAFEMASVVNTIIKSDLFSSYCTASANYATVLFFNIVLVPVTYTHVNRLGHI